MKAAFVNTVMELAQQDSSIVLITGDLGFGVLTPFSDAFPNRFINAGISEQNMTSVAAGLAMEGKTVLTYSIGNFNTLRCLEQIRNDVAYHNAAVTIVSVGGGFAYGALGMSHHATEDIAVMRSMPNMKVFVPSDPLEAAATTRLAVSSHSPCYIRLGRGKEPLLHKEPMEIRMGQAACLRPGGDVAILSVGPVSSQAVLASEALAEDGIQCSVYVFPCVKPIDTACILHVAASVSHIFTLEEHTTLGGLGGSVAEVLASNPCHAPLTRLGLEDVFTTVIGTQEYLRQYYGLDSQSVTRTIKAVVQQQTT